MKRHVQLPGIRLWAGEDWLEIQDETLSVLDGFFGQYGTYILEGCRITGEDENRTVSPGLVVLAGKNSEGKDTVMVARFAGAENVALPLYLTLANRVEVRDYEDDVERPVAYEYYAEASAEEPAEGVTFLLLNEKTPRFVDVIQDEEHRFLTAKQIADLAKSPKYRGSVQADADANDLTEYGVYNLNLGDDCVNFPTDSVKGVMVVSVADDQVNQKVTDMETGIFWERSSLGGTWSKWYQAAKSDLTNVELDPSWKLFEQTGYWQSPDGLMVQWGRVNPLSISGGSIHYFPKAFKQAFAITTVAYTETASNTIAYYSAVRFLTETYFKVMGYGIVGVDCNYIAVGTWK